MKSRIEYIIRDNNLTSAKFAEILGVQKANISHILTGRNRPSLEIFIKILEKFPKINSEWLSFGKGNMYKSTEENISELSNSDSFGTLFDSNNDNIIPNPTLKEEESPIYFSKSGKSIRKIIVYYSDNTFQEFNG